MNARLRQCVFCRVTLLHSVSWQRTASGICRDCNPSIGELSTGESTLLLLNIKFFPGSEPLSTKPRPSDVSQLDLDTN